MILPQLALIYLLICFPLIDAKCVPNRRTSRGECREMENRGCKVKFLARGICPNGIGEDGIGCQRVARCSAFSRCRALCRTSFARGKGCRWDGSKCIRRVTNKPTKGGPRAPNNRKPTSKPHASPTALPTPKPTIQPTLNPSSKNPTSSPSKNPTNNPSNNPSGNPTVNPSSNPSDHPTTHPTRNPSAMPTIPPTINPTKEPTYSPTTVPVGEE
jgi:hypothetical protein